MEDRFISSGSDTSKSIFIDVKEASLVNVLKIISQQSGLSFIAAQDVADRKITLYLNKVPLNQALQMVLDANDLTYEMQSNSNVFVVKAKEKTAKNMITRVYQLKYATVSSSKLNSTISFSSQGGSSPGAASSSSGSTSSSSGSGSSSLGSASSSSGSGSSSSGSSGLEQVIKEALSPDGKVVEDTRTNSLIITDVPGQFDSIESTIAKLDVPVPQVLIEVEMLDVSKSTADQLGITYGATPISFTGASEAVNYPLSLSRSTVSNASSSSSNSSPSSGSTNNTPFTPGLINTSGLTATLNFLTTSTDARTLARPRILTLNNETAQIEISTDQAIDIVPSSTSTGTSGSTQTYTVDRYATGVILKVTPQANLLTHEITMAVSPKVIDVILSEVQPPTSIGGSVYDPETRGSDSILKLKDGQSMVIGGLMTNQTNKTVTKLPFLGDLPLIGAAFRSKTEQKTERELIIFLTPHIIDYANQSALKGDSSSIPAEASLDTQDASDRVQEINNSLNTYEMKKY
jgi:type IV pilus assembly protein PilQ